MAIGGLGDGKGKAHTACRKNVWLCFFSIYHWEHNNRCGRGGAPRTLLPFCFFFLALLAGEPGCHVGWHCIPCDITSLRHCPLLRFLGFCTNPHKPHEPPTLTRPRTRTGRHACCTHAPTGVRLLVPQNRPSIKGNRAFSVTLLVLPCRKKKSRSKDTSVSHLGTESWRRGGSLHQKRAGRALPPPPPQLWRPSAPLSGEKETTPTSAVFQLLVSLPPPCCVPKLQFGTAF
ncbi:hypothetical protein BC827DRAFT_634496 [Russula dissimulans]|nr:hypothetical protein BC827DRAFT_634496 [Russula dissimulans]